MLIMLTMMTAVITASQFTKTIKDA